MAWICAAFPLTVLLLGIAYSEIDLWLFDRKISREYRPLTAAEKQRLRRAFWSGLADPYGMAPRSRRH